MPTILTSEILGEKKAVDTATSVTGLLFEGDGASNAMRDVANFAKQSEANEVLLIKAGRQESQYQRDNKKLSESYNLDKIVRLPSEVPPTSKNPDDVLLTGISDGKYTRDFTRAEVEGNESLNALYKASNEMIATRRELSEKIKGHGGKMFMAAAGAGAYDKTLFSPEADALIKKTDALQSALDRGHSEKDNQATVLRGGDGLTPLGTGVVAGGVQAIR